MAEIKDSKPSDTTNGGEAEKDSDNSDELPDAIYSKSFYAILEDIEINMLGEEDSEIPRRISFIPQDFGEQQMFVRDIYKQNEEIAIRLANMKLNNQQPEPIVDLDNVPDSYKNNSDTEKNMLKIIEKFIWNFKQTYPARAEPFIVAYNECGVQKILPTYILPVDLPFFELFRWEACAEFVADYLLYDGLELPVRVPFIVCSPGYSVDHQSGNSLDFSMVLCSMLLARSYDAYVVQGYASKEVCEMDEREKIYETEENENDKKEHNSSVTDYVPVKLKLVRKMKKQSVAENHRNSEEMEADSMKNYEIKYGPRPPRQLYSKFREAMLHKKESQTTKATIIEESTPIDVLAGRRVHFWVLMRSKDISDSSCFYIESSTAERIEINDPNYQYIESVWNNHNFWVNLQDHQAKKENAYFKFNDSDRWMPLLTTSEGTIMDMALHEELYMPSSWTIPITLSREDVSRRYPDGKKVRYFKNLRYQTFAPFSMTDGLVSKITFYSDEEYKLPIETIEHYFNRSDQLIKQRIFPLRNTIHEYFSPYRIDGLKEHIHNISDLNSWEDERTICFRISARMDGLSKITRCKNILIEEYEGRDDKLFQKVTTLATGKETMNLEKVHHIISSIEEYYLRNPNVNCDNNVEKRVFDIKNKRYFVKFHTGENRIAYSYLELQKPIEKVKGHGFELTSDMWREYQVDDEAPPRSRIDVYRYAAKLVEDEAKAITALQNSQKIITDILYTRLKERLQLELEPSVHDVHKNEYVKKKERESEEIEESEEKEEVQKARKLDDEMKWDYLAPYILELGCPTVLSNKQAQTVFQCCMFDYKNHLFRRRDKLQSDLKKEREILSEKVEWFKRFQSSLLKEQEEETHEFITNSQLCIEVLEERLKKWHVKTPKFLQDLKEQLKNDYRLAEHIN